MGHDPLLECGLVTTSLPRSFDDFNNRSTLYVRTIEGIPERRGGYLGTTLQSKISTTGDRRRFHSHCVDLGKTRRT